MSISEAPYFIRHRWLNEIVGCWQVVNRSTGQVVTTHAYHALKSPGSEIARGEAELSAASLIAQAGGLVPAGGANGHPIPAGYDPLHATNGKANAQPPASASSSEIDPLDADAAWEAAIVDAVEEWDEETVVTPHEPDDRSLSFARKLRIEANRLEASGELSSLSAGYLATLLRNYAQIVDKFGGESFADTKARFDVIARGGAE